VQGEGRGLGRGPDVLAAYGGVYFGGDGAGLVDYRQSVSKRHSDRLLWLQSSILCVTLLTRCLCDSCLEFEIPFSKPCLLRPAQIRYAPIYSWVRIEILCEVQLSQGSQRFQKGNYRFAVDVLHGH
jgi:hypothetical protein